jgi:hypothetical protein
MPLIPAIKRTNEDKEDERSEDSLSEGGIIV